MIRRIVILAALVAAGIILAATAATAATDGPVIAQTTGDAIQAGIGLVVFAAAAKGVLGFLKSLRAREWNAVLTTVTWWGAGIALVFMFSLTRWDDIEIFGLMLGDANAGELVLLGAFGIGNLGVAWNQNEKAKDASQTAIQPALFGPGAGQGAPGEIPPLAGFTGETIDPEVAEAAGSFTAPDDTAPTG